MKRRRKNKRKERMIMLGSSVMVLSALTVTGLYVKEKKEVPKEEYVVDLSELEEVETEEYAYEDSEKEEDSREVTSLDVWEKEDMWTATDKTWKDEEEEVETEEVFLDIFTAKEEELSFSEEDRLLWPVVGNVLINYDMEKPVYFSTLDQFKLNPAIFTMMIAIALRFIPTLINEANKILKAQEKIKFYQEHQASMSETQRSLFEQDLDRLIERDARTTRNSQKAT